VFLPRREALEKVPLKISLFFNFRIGSRKLVPNLLMVTCTWQGPILLILRLRALSFSENRQSFLI
jgi:hypothetical protein